MEKENAIREIAAKHLHIETLETRRSDSLDFHEVAVWSVKAALAAAYDAGWAAASQGEAEPAAERSGEWTTMTIDDAVEHLKTWIDNLDDPSQIATLMIHVCGCPRAAVIDGTHISVEMP
jgi:hypothetical protein